MVTSHGILHKKSPNKTNPSFPKNHKIVFLLERKHVKNPDPSEIYLITICSGRQTHHLPRPQKQTPKLRPGKFSPVNLDR